MISTNTTVTTTPTRLLARSNSYRTVYLHVLGNGTVYVGGSNVTSANGMITQKHAVPLELFIPAEEELWAVVAESTEQLRLLAPEYYAD